MNSLIKDSKLVIFEKCGHLPQEEMPERVLEEAMSFVGKPRNSNNEYHRSDTYADVNRVLHELLTGAQSILGSHFVGMYLFGSLANGDFDQHSDVDFVVVTGSEISGDLFLALQALHMQIATLDSWCATQLDGSYISQHALRRYDPTQTLHPHIDRGKGESLQMRQHDSDWVIQRHILREQGVTVRGPAPKILIDPVSPNELQQAVRTILNTWFALMLDDPSTLKRRGYQSYTVLTMSRMLYTLDFGTVVSKPVAVRWAREALGEEWALLMERAWAGRQHPHLEADADDVIATLNFIRYTIKHSQLNR